MGTVVYRLQSSSTPTPVIPHNPEGLTFCRGADRILSRLKRMRGSSRRGSILAPPCIFCVALGERLSLSEPHVPCL